MSYYKLRSIAEVKMISKNDVIGILSIFVVYWFHDLHSIPNPIGGSCPM